MLYTNFATEKRVDGKLAKNNQIFARAKQAIAF